MQGLVLAKWVIFANPLDCAKESSDLWLFLKIAKFEIKYHNKNSVAVDIAPALGEITTACNVGQANWVKVHA